MRSFSTIRRWVRPVLHVVLCAGGLALAASCQQEGGAPADPGETPAVVVEPDGTVHVPAMTVPVSEFLSPEGQTHLADHLYANRQAESVKLVDGVPAYLRGYMDRQSELYPVVKTDTEIAGIHVFDYAPEEGVSAENKRRVLINLHGGAFLTCWPACAELESVPIAALGGIRVVSVDYRQGPDHRFPAASEDVAAVYGELLKTYPPENIGIYGCSAGGMLTGMAVAWFQKHDLPAPGAIGIYCAGSAPPVMGFGGDANYTTAAIGEARAPFPAPEKAATDGPVYSPMLYLSEVDARDPLVAPTTSDEVLSKFPPTQIITATRGFELSSAVYTHSRLVKLGVETELHVWEGLFHGFFYNPDPPESRDAYNVMVKFFDEHLGK
ncbi:alpha/beta hydrolase fold domain-containing protein [Hyphococcus sp.]|uniref:alpha/beta hydrolase fold domain-containing protein n=1 Tax=Hyphococcus sp. TaxID=2038636 RepID=UPI003D1479BE